MGTENESTDDLERAFCEAVERFALGEWSPALPKKCTVGVGHERYSIREICLLIRGNNRRLPEQTVAQLFQNIRAQHDQFRQKLTVRPLYKVGAQCLIDLMDDREAVYALREACRR
jgi:hypothetical protein